MQETDIIMTKLKITSAALLLFTVAVSAQTFSSPLGSEKKPWTAIPQGNSDTYKFVVLPDKTGGSETGAFEKAIEEINRIAPDFVINVGDLVEGFVSDVKFSEPQWADMKQRLSKLEVPFFLVGGNHDLSSQAQTEDYIRRFGCTYYSFSYGPDLFLVLDTQEHSGRDISDTQVEYFRKVLDSWKGRHIYVFMHSPLWYPQNHGGYEYIDDMLQGHQYTVFSGHTHIYYYEERGGMEYYVVATAGGDSELRGAEVGEFDHYMLVTARDGKPAIANIPIGAMVANDVVNKNNAPVIGYMLGGGFLKVPYLILENKAPESFTFTLKAENPMDIPMHYAFAFPDAPGLRFEPCQSEGTLAPHESKSFEIKAGCKGIDEVGRIKISTTCGYSLNGKMKDIAGTTSLFTDIIRNLPLGSVEQICCRDPYKIEESWDYHGVDDGWFEFSVEHGRKSVKVSVTPHDDIRATDRMFVVFESGGSVKEYEVNLDDAVVDIPAKLVKDNRFSLNIKWIDNDDIQELDPSVLWWRLPDKPGEFRF